MKALDTAALLTLLEGAPATRAQLARLRGSELATTEANLLELSWLAASAPPRARSSRLAAIARLRRRLTVLPIDARGAEEAQRRLARSGTAMSPLVVAMLGALEAYGCEELLTDDPAQFQGTWRFRIRALAKRAPSNGGIDTRASPRRYRR
jgi:predicted nucleic acid-binding protein